jgi:hypothetical protein
MNAYVFVSTEVDEAKKVAQKIAKLAGVKLADCCWGIPDVIVFADVAEAKALDGLVVVNPSNFCDFDHHQPI